MSTFSSFGDTFFNYNLIVEQKTEDGPKIQPGVGPLKDGVDPQEEAKYHGFYQVIDYTRVSSYHGRL